MKKKKTINSLGNKSGIKKGINWGLMSLAIPGLVFLIAFYYVPLFVGFVVPFKQVDYAKGIFGSDWVGLKNFKFLFESQDAFRITKNTLCLNGVFIAVTLVTAIFLAVLMNELTRKKIKIYQTAMFVPYFVSWVVASYIVYALLSPDKEPTDEQLMWSAKVAVAQQKLVDEFNLDALTYYYHGAPGSHYEDLQGGFIVGHSILTANGIPCAGEGDLKTCLAMKICDILDKGGSFCEIITTDYVDGTILLGHDGPFHLKIAKGKPILRGMGMYHGKQGKGVSVEAKVKPGDITNLACTQHIDGKLKFLITEAQATDGEIMRIGNTQTPVRFKDDPDTYMNEWFSYAPTHHFAMSVGKNASVMEKVSTLLGIAYVLLDQ